MTQSPRWKKFGHNGYAIEGLTAKLGATYLCAEFGIAMADKGNHANFDHWLKLLKENKHCLITVAGEASKAVSFLQESQPD